jgi:hypothetical protein
MPKAAVQEYDLPKFAEYNVGFSGKGGVVDLEAVSG